MLQDGATKHFARLLLNFSDLGQTDDEIALCLNYLHIPSPSGVKWTAADVRDSIPAAYTTVCTASEYATTTPAAINYCQQFIAPPAKS